jgi:erythronate-4-phosphate dehydrogenase
VIPVKIYYEDSLPYAAEFFAELGQCRVFSHRTVNAQQVADADILLVRSTTKVDAKLLQLNQDIQYVATATAGTNHLDTTYLRERQLDFASAAGCNATAVAEYVLSALVVMAQRLGWQLADKTLGIVGAGHAGTTLANKLTALGIPYKLCDPPLQEQGDPRDWVSMQDIMQCDVISLHVPLIQGTPYATHHMFDSERLAQLRDDQLLINACRGEVVDNQALLDCFENGRKLQVVMDVWENEPHINLALVPYISLATAHIAGHTIEGKARGTEILYQQVCKRLHKPVEKFLADFLPPAQPGSIDIPQGLSGQALFTYLILSVYDISQDSQQFKHSVHQPDQFGYIRKNYSIRREFAALKVNTGNLAGSEAIYALGFTPG